LYKSDMLIHWSVLDISGQFIDNSTLKAGELEKPKENRRWRSVKSSSSPAIQCLTQPSLKSPSHPSDHAVTIPGVMFSTSGIARFSHRAGRWSTRAQRKVKLLTFMAYQAEALCTTCSKERAPPQLILGGPWSISERILWV
jgi:hypothetical protein